MKRATAILAVMFALLTMCSAQQFTPVNKHVIVIMEENHRYSDVLAKMPYLVGLGSKYAHTSNYHADESGSLLDYLWISSGSGEHAFGCTGGGCASPITSDNIFREINSAGMSWKSYQESIPYAGYMGSGSGLYVKRHNPAPYYSDVINSKTEQMKIVPFTQFAIDVANGALPNYSFVTPNLVNDAHNHVGTTDVRLETADAWLSNNLPQLLKSKYFQPGGDGLLIVTFDECDGASTGICGGATELVYTAMIGPKVKPGSTSSVLYKHENSLRTIAESLGIKKFPGASAAAVAMNDMLIPDGLLIQSPADGSTISTTVHVQATDQRAQRMEVWVDHIKRFQIVGNAVDTTMQVAAGAGHRFAVVGVENGIAVKIVESVTTK